MKTEESSNICKRFRMNETVIKQDGSKMKDGMVCALWEINNLENIIIIWLNNFANLHLKTSIKNDYKRYSWQFLRTKYECI